MTQFPDCTALVHIDIASLQVSDVHDSPSLQASGAVPMQDPPPSHADVDVQNMPSSHALPFALFDHALVD